MSGKLIRGVAILIVFASPTHAADPGNELLTTPLRWRGVEVVTNDFDSVERIRRTAALPENRVLLVSDPALTKACAAVRQEFPSSSVKCFPLFGPPKDGSPEAWYVIEMDIAQRERSACSSDATMGADLIALADTLRAAFGRAVLAGSLQEFVNDRRVLDYKDPSMSALAAQMHAQTKDRVAELEAGGASCDPRARVSAFYLMSYAGDPDRFTALAARHIHDDDPGAANAATRFLILFAGFVPKEAAVSYALEACKSILDGGFTDRNKSLSLLSEWQSRGVVSFSQLGPECQRHIREIARTSVAEQIAGPARSLIGG